MPVNIEIFDVDLQGFSDPAKEKLSDAVTQFSTSLIEEANRIESGRNATNGVIEITRSMVSDAALVLRRGLGTPKKRFGTLIIRVIASVLSLIVGFMYDGTKLQDNTYMLIFIMLVAATILAVTISAIKE